MWELTPPIFVGALLAIVAVVFLMNKQRALLEGPQGLANWLFGAPHTCPAAGCTACRTKTKERYTSCGLKHPK